jgi:16S rRNA (guanine1207-N2)-methyltransferase
MEHYFSESPSSSVKENSFSALLRGKKLCFASSAGVFSKNEVDAGTRLLVEKCIMQDGWTVLDLGCGYGAVGVSIAKSFSGKVVMSDVNERALLLSLKNLELNSCAAEVIKSFAYDSLSKYKESFDTILANPPQKAGKEICMRMIDDAPLFLRKNGLLQIVARPNAGGASLEKEIRKVFGTCEIIARKGGFAVYAGMKK